MLGSGADYLSQKLLDNLDNLREEMPNGEMGRVGKEPGERALGHTVF